MTQKEKAQEILDKFNDVALTLRGKKKFAFIVVDEIINEYQQMSDLKSMICLGEDYYTVVQIIEWWRGVREEMENI